MITTTLEQSERLRQLGAPQNTALFWYVLEDGYDPSNNEIGLVLAIDAPQEHKGHTFTAKRYAAYTLNDLIEWLGSDFTDLHRRSAESGFIAKGYRREDLITTPAISEGATPLDALVALYEAVKGENG